MIRFRLLTQPIRAGALPPLPRDISGPERHNGPRPMERMRKIETLDAHATANRKG